jgi:hypothetical protein
MASEIVMYLLALSLPVWLVAEEPRLVPFDRRSEA